MNKLAGQADASVSASRRSAATALALGLLPWPFVALGLYGLHRAWAAFALYHAACLLAWIFARSPLPVLSEPLSVIRRRHWAALGSACLIVNVAVYFSASCVTALLAPHHLSSALASLGIGSDILDRAALFAYFGLVNPVVEELFWRQTVYARLRVARWSPRWSACVSGAFFGAWHWLPIHLLLPGRIVLPAVVGVAATGVLLALVYERLRRLQPAVLIHALGADIPILVALWVDVLSRR